VSAPELSVVCRSCGSEVSPYVTECPYCGARLRKRAPRLERHGDELTPRESRRRGRQLRRQQRRARRAAAAERLGARPYASILAIVAPALLLLVVQALAVPLTDVGAILGDPGGEWWRYIAAPSAYSNLGYLFACALAIAIFGPAVESRLGTIPTAVLIVACGSLGMLAADGLQGLFDENQLLIAAGGNGIALGLLAAWAVLRAAEARAQPGEEVELIGAGVAATVLVLLPVVVDWADVFAGLAGAAVGAACGLAAALAGREKRPGV
jgi:membrane associated rhomboid family serine protease